MEYTFVQSFMEGKLCPNCTHENDTTFCGQCCVYGDSFSPKEEESK